MQRECSYQEEWIWSRSLLLWIKFPSFLRSSICSASERVKTTSKIQYMMCSFHLDRHLHQDLDAIHFFVLPTKETFHMVLTSSRLLFKIKGHFWRSLFGRLELKTQKNKNCIFELVYCTLICCAVHIILLQNNKSK